MARRRQIYEGKAKMLYEGPEPGTLIQYFKDDATAFNAQKRGTISGKGVSSNRSCEWASQDEMNDIADMAIRVNDFLSGMFAAIGIRVIDFKLEFGRVWDGDYARVILADEISPDGCRLWDIKSGQKLDKDRFRQDLGGVEEAYQEVARRLGLLQPEEESAVLDLDSHRKKRGR